MHPARHVFPHVSAFGEPRQKSTARKPIEKRLEINLQKQCLLRVLGEIGRKLLLVKPQVGPGEAPFSIRRSCGPSVTASGGHNPPSISSREPTYCEQHLPALPAGAQLGSNPTTGVLSPQSPHIRREMQKTNKTSPPKPFRARLSLEAEDR